MAFLVIAALGIALLAKTCMDFEDEAESISQLSAFSI